MNYWKYFFHQYYDVIYQIKQIIFLLIVFKIPLNMGPYTGADPGFQVRGWGAHLKKLRRAKGGTKMFGVFRVKITILRQFFLFFPILGGRFDIDVELFLIPMNLS